MKIKKSTVLYWFAAVLPFLISAAFYARVPEQIAIHWNANGIADGYSSKAFALFGLPAMMLAVTILINVMLKIDPRRQNIDRSPQMKQTALWLIVILDNILDVLIILYALNVRFNMSMAVISIVGIGIALIGNYLPKCKFNYTMGIRVPWTLASEDNWRKTHRMAGPVWVAGGILILLSGLLNQIWMLYVAMILLILIPIIYSYMLSTRENRQ
ncbi:MAG: Immunity protein SdpI [Oscillospiraceae bacterium]|jgi:uncharacterized membrane protein